MLNKKLLLLILGLSIFKAYSMTENENGQKTVIAELVTAEKFEETLGEISVVTSNLDNINGKVEEEGSLVSKKEQRRLKRKRAKSYENITLPVIAPGPTDSLISTADTSKKLFEMETIPNLQTGKKVYVFSKVEADKASQQGGFPNRFVMDNNYKNGNGHENESSSTLAASPNLQKRTVNLLADTLQVQRARDLQNDQQIQNQSATNSSQIVTNNPPLVTPQVQTQAGQGAQNNNQTQNSSGQTQNGAGQNNQPQHTPSPETFDLSATLKKWDDNIEGGMGWVNKNRWYSLAGSVISTLFLYKIFGKSVKETAHRFKNYCEGKLWDILIKFEDVKENGFTKWDYIKGIVTVLVSGSLGAGIYYYDINNSIDLIKEFFRLLRVYKIEVGSGVLGIVLTDWLYQLKKSYENRQSRVMNFDNFLAHLSEDQRRFIFNSEDLLVAIGKGGDNHKRLLKNKEFMNLLTEDQKTYLKNIVIYRCSAVRNEV